MKIRCPKCGEEKPDEEFHRNKSRKSGRANYCKKCAVAAVRRWQQTHKDIVKANNAKNYMLRRYGNDITKVDIKITEIKIRS